MNSYGAQPLNAQPPSKLASLIGKYVSINTNGHSNYEGFIDAIDPITGRYLNICFNYYYIKLSTNFHL